MFTFYQILKERYPEKYRARNNSQQKKPDKEINKVDINCQKELTDDEFSGILTEWKLYPNLETATI